MQEYAITTIHLSMLSDKDEHQMTSHGWCHPLKVQTVYSLWTIGYGPMFVTYCRFQSVALDVDQTYNDSLISNSKQHCQKMKIILHYQYAFEEP